QDLDLYTSNTSRVRISGSTGYVGIGTSSPGTPLTVYGNASSTPVGYVYVSNTGLFTNSGWAGYFGAMEMANRDQTNGNVEYLSFSGSPGAGNSVAVIGATNQNHSSNYGDLWFWTRGSTGYGVRMLISQIGNVGIGVTSPSTNLEVSGTVSATRFVGDGSGLTNIGAAGSSDRIVSGTTSLIAISSTGFISLTQAGTNTGWFDPTRGLVTIGVSSTGPISGTNGYFSGNVGVGTNSPAMALTVSGDLLVGGNGVTATIYLVSNTSIDAAPRAAWMEKGYASPQEWSFYNSPNGTSAPFKFYSGTRGTTPDLTISKNSAVFAGSVTMAQSASGGPTIGNPNMTTSGNLTIYNTGSPYGTALFLSNQASKDIQLAFGAYNSVEYAAIRGLYGGSSQVGSLGFYTSNGASEIERLRITNTGDVGIGTTTPTTALEVSGTVSATRFVGDGSGLTGLSGGSGDRITSGTTTLMAISSTSFVSLTQAGTNTGWFDPTRGLVTIGLSSTGPISATNGYFSSTVGIGTAPAVSSSYSKLMIAGLCNQMDIHSGLQTNGLQLSGGDVCGGGDYHGPGNGSSAAVVNTQNGSLYLGTNNSAKKVLTASGNAGIDTLTPAATLQVSGTFIVSNSAQVTTPSIYVGSGTGNVGIGTNNPLVNLQINSVSGPYIWLTGNNGTIADTSGGGLQIGNTGNSGIRFSVGANAGTYGNNEVARFTPAGLGIGTQTPSATLEVSGTIKMSGSTGNVGCTSSDYGLMRFNNGRAQICLNR
ncbi:MAG TPA: hypothetical protein VHA37_09375, partial [Candidatus Saccharimonadales bacterium]|nr:hypothetical protein [Candidatus Saccharimonadales bacterium]